MKKKNCWEFKKCGIKANGAKAYEFGICPAVTFALSDGFPGRNDGGRECAYITGTYSQETIRGLYRDKKKDCDSCPFFQLLQKDEGAQIDQVEFF